MIFYSVIAALVIMCASLSGVIFTSRRLGGWMEKNLPFLATFSIGIFAVITWGLLSEAIEHAAILVVIVSVLAGAILIELLSLLIPDAHHHHDPYPDHKHSDLDARRIILGDAVHNIGDGLLLVPAFLVDIRLGIATALGIFLHELVQEISEFFILREAGYTTRQALLRNFIASASILIGVFAGAFLSSIESLHAPLIGLSAGGFLYIILRDLVPHTVNSIRKKGHGDKHIKALVAGVLIMLAVTILTPHEASAQEVLQDKQETVKAKVVEIVNEKTEVIPGTDTEQFVQELRVELRGGENSGQVVQITNDYSPLEVGDALYVIHIIPWDGTDEVYAMSEPYRLPALIWLTVFFILAVIVFGGRQGIRGLLSLIASLAFIGLFLLPGIMNGYSPVLVSIGVASLIIILGSYITHGFNKTTSAAVIGMIVTVAFVGLIAHLSINWTDLSGFGNDEATYLNFNFDGRINLLGLLLGGILIGLLGVMYDAAIGQSISVEELHRIAPHISRKTIYARAIRIGREHIGALVNTLAIAYVGASLPLLLLFYGSAESASVMINREIFATEIIRSLVGSIGLILTVPITTLISVWMIVKNKGEADPTVIAKEKEAMEHVGHSH